jgi:hypothetical protein
MGWSFEAPPRFIGFPRAWSFGRIKLADLISPVAEAFLKDQIATATFC